ncbi:ABC-type transport system involved in resistance to organic solvents, permease component [Rhodospirillaceae bacterium LM-1]|nr:ABC-type transport system involved in resistance to organic solvents, permease component [Rhodospirillaceae bacterium LM-1]
MPARHLRIVEKTGRATIAGIAEIGYGAFLLGESLFWLVMGKSRRQPVRFGAVVAEAMEFGVRAIPIVAILSGTVGAMLAIQGIHTLKTFGAESRVTFGVALSVVREFAPLITGIVVAGRSGSALAARLGTMRINQEIDALHVMGIDPVRFLVAPALLAMLAVLPLLTLLADFVALTGAGMYICMDLGMDFPAYWERVIESLKVDDLGHGLGKSVIFAVLVTLVGVVNGSLVQGGAEGVGKATTRSVVHAISAIVVTDMLFAFVLTR